MTIGIIYYSTYGSTFALAQHIAAGVAAADAGQDAVLRRVHELMPDDRLDENARATVGAQSEVEYADVDELITFDGLIIGSPTRFGNRHHGMVVVPLGHVADELQSTRTGGGPYGPTHFPPTDGSKTGLSDDEIAIGIAYGRQFAKVAAKLAA